MSCKVLWLNLMSIALQMTNQKFQFQKLFKMLPHHQVGKRLKHLEEYNCSQITFLVQIWQKNKANQIVTCTTFLDIRKHGQRARSLKRRFNKHFLKVFTWTLNFAWHVHVCRDNLVTTTSPLSFFYASLFPPQRCFLWWLFEVDNHPWRWWETNFHERIFIS